MKKDYDIIVVGAGFGGPVAAKACADAGLDTLILERADTPGQKVISSCTIPFYGFFFGPEWIREGNPPIERPVTGIRNFFVRNGKTYDFDASFRVPKALESRVAIGYTTYCRPFCTWLADRAVESGAELRTSTTVVDVLREGDKVTGVVLDNGEELRCKLLISAEGLQNLLAIKAGIRKRYKPETIEAALLLDFEMPKERIDQVCGYHLEYFWSMPEEHMVSPLGQGSAVYIFPYRDSLHLTIGRFLKADDGVAPVAKVLDEYYDKFFTSERWQKSYAPYAKLRARIWDTCPLYVGLYPEMRNMPMVMNGMMLLGDAAGLESTAIADGVPTAWFSADLAGKWAIDALRAKDVSAGFLAGYEQAVRNHPLINAVISDPHRRDLLYAQKSGDEAEMRRRINQGWGIRVLGHLGLPLTLAMLREVKRDPRILKSWMGMYKRYFELYG